MIHEFPPLNDIIKYIDVDSSGSFFAVSGDFVLASPISLLFYDLHTYLPVHHKISIHQTSNEITSLSISSDNKYLVICDSNTLVFTVSI